MAGMSRTAPEDRGGSIGRDGRPDPATEAFLAHRNLLFTVAYEMLGSAADAEDVLQETWLRWAGVDLDTVRDQRAYLIRITTRQALGRLRTLGRRKESYVGSWLPEPLLTAPDVAEDVELAESVSMAMLLVLETLTPTERAVFVLREVFDLAYDEVAEAVGKSPAAVRQIVHRARAHVAARRPRGVVSPAETRDALDAFQRAAETGDLQSLLDILAPDVVFLGDGGGIKQAVPRPIVGADKVARLLAIGLGRIAAVVAAAGTGQRLPGADRPAQRRDRHRRSGTHRRRPHHRTVRRAQSREAVAYGAGDHPAPLSPGRRRRGEPRPCLPGSGRRREELERNSIRVAEGDARAIMGVLDSAVRNAELVQARGPGLQLTTVTAGEGHVIEAGAMLIEPATCAIGVGVQAEQLPSIEREHRVVKTAGLLVLVEHGRGAQQLAVPASASVQISHGHRDVGDRWKLGHSSLLVDGESPGVITDVLSRAR